MLRSLTPLTAFTLSQARTNLCRLRLIANANPSLQLQARISAVSGSTVTEAPRKQPAASLATAAEAILPVFFRDHSIYINLHESFRNAALIDNSTYYRSKESEQPSIYLRLDELLSGCTVKVCLAQAGIRISRTDGGDLPPKAGKQRRETYARLGLETIVDGAQHRVSSRLGTRRPAAHDLS